MLDRILSALDGVWPALKKFLGVVNKSDSTLLGLKEAMCKAQEKFFGGLKTVCDRIDSVVALVGGKIDMLITLMADVGAKVNCKEATQAINKRVEEIVKRLSKTGKLFAVCEYEPVLTDCHALPKREGNLKSFMDDVFEFGKLLLDIVDLEKNGGKGEAGVKAFVAKISSELHTQTKTEITQLSKNKIDYSKITDALAQVAKLAKTNPLTSLARVVHECRPSIERSASTAENIISGLDKQFRRLVDLVSASAANPDTVVTDLAKIFKDVGELATTNAGMLFDSKSHDKCVAVVLTKVPAPAADPIVSILKAANSILPQIQTPMYKVAEVSFYIAGALECGARLVPPIKRATTIILDLMRDGRFTPEIIGTAVAQLSDVFAEPLQCVTKDIIKPLNPLLAPYIKAMSQSPEAQNVADQFNEKIARAKKYENALKEQVARAKNFANAIGRAIGSVQELIAAGMTVYGGLKQMVTAVQKYQKAGSIEGFPPGLSTALSATRVFQKGINDFIGPLRQLREILQLFALDEQTLLNILDVADHTLVGLEAGCDLVKRLVLQPPAEEAEEASFLETGVVEHLNQRIKSLHLKSQMVRQAGSDKTLPTKPLPTKPLPKPLASGAQQAGSGELLKKIAEMEKMLRSQHAKLDQLQESADTMSAQMHANGGSGGVKGTMDAGEIKEMRSESKKLPTYISTR